MALISYLNKYPKQAVKFTILSIDSKDQSNPLPMSILLGMLTSICDIIAVPMLSKIPQLCSNPISFGVKSVTQ